VPVSEPRQAYATPLHWWSETNYETAEFFREIGRAYATAMDGSQPNEETIADLKARVRRIAANLGKAERMEAGPLPSSEPSK
jgi:N-glycosylase/DNA lyase